ncbi:hypothetical protein J6590_044605 [Homalodisca vitripennis]|nr:hypothetical protein J6590_044605 [Homalodisca vitripennis]
MSFGHHHNKKLLPVVESKRRSRSHRSHYKGNIKQRLEMSVEWPCHPGERLEIALPCLPFDAGIKQIVRLFIVNSSSVHAKSLAVQL